MADSGLAIHLAKLELISFNSWGGMIFLICCLTVVTKTNHNALLILGIPQNSGRDLTCEQARSWVFGRPRRV